MRSMQALNSSVEIQNYKKKNNKFFQQECNTESSTTEDGKRDMIRMQTVTIVVHYCYIWGPEGYIGQ